MTDRPPRDDPRFAYPCARDWSALTVTDDPEVRYCDHCDRNVTAFADEAAARIAARGGACVALAARSTPVRGTPAVRPRAKVLGYVASDGEGPPQVAWLVPLEGPRAGVTIKLGGTTSLSPAEVGGRADATAVQIVATASGWLLVDEDGRAGVRVNGRDVVRFELVDGDRLAFAGIELMFKSTL